MQETLSFQHYFLSLLAVANNISAIGMFVAICQGRSKEEQLKLCRVATLTAVITMLTAMLAGKLILEFFEISINAFRIAGGLLLCSTGLNMLQSDPSDDEKTTIPILSKVIPVAIVPIGIPLTTGGGTISTVIMFSGPLTDWALTLRLLAAILLMGIVIFLIFRYSAELSHYLGAVGLDVVVKIMGLITLAIGVQFVITGLSALFPVLLK